MDIELSLREMLVLENPGARFTDGVMARVADMPVRHLPDGVVRLAEARARKRSRRILFGTLLVVGAAASMLPWMMRGPAGAAVVRESSVAAPVAEAAHVDPEPQLQALAQSTPSVGSATPSQCVDPDVLRGLLLQLPEQGFRIGVATPPELATFKAPRQLSWLGSAERGQGGALSTALVYRTGLSPDAAATAVDAALAGSGWRHADNRSVMNVFSALQSRSGETYCREGKPVTVSTNSLDDVTYVVFTTLRSEGNAGVLVNACDLPPQSGARSAAALDKYLPQLELPRDPATGLPAPLQGGGSGGIGEGRRLNVSFTATGTADNVARHFARQMAAQGWRADTSWSGSATAGSSWTRPGDADSLLQGTLLVSAFDEGLFTVALHVSTTK